jgi:hypothetical protein
VAEAYEPESKRIGIGPDCGGAGEHPQRPVPPQQIEVEELLGETRSQVRRMPFRASGG